MSTRFRLFREVNTTGFGDTGMRLGDLDGDGEQELVFFQARDCHIPRMSAGGYRHEKKCLRVCVLMEDLADPVLIGPRQCMSIWFCPLELKLLSQCLSYFR